MAAEQESVVRVVHFAHPSREIYGKGGRLAKLIKADDAKDSIASYQAASLGLQQHPYDMVEVIGLKNHNPHHSTCIEAKVASTVGLGFKVLADGTEAGPPQTLPGPLPTPTPVAPQAEPEEDKEDMPSKVETVLGPLTDVSFQDILNDAVEDYWQVGNGYVEVVRRDGDNITGLHHIPGPDARVYVEDVLHNSHFVIQPQRGAAGGERHFARFGDLEGFLQRNPNFKREEVSEVIHLRRSSSLSRVYGYADWLAAIPSIELVQALHQFAFDFYMNRGVPEFMLFLLGAKVSEKDMEVIEEAIKATIGFGNSHKTIAVNIAAENIQVQLERLGMEGQGEDFFQSKSEVLALAIVTAHRVPPLLAGIQIPGKLGATNELPNALRAFQQLVVGKAQNEISTVLGRTLGNPEHNNGLPLVASDFRLRKITDVIDTQKMDTSTRMRQTEPEAEAEGRDLSEGVRE